MHAKNGGHSIRDISVFEIFDNDNDDLGYQAVAVEEAVCVCWEVGT